VGKKKSKSKKEVLTFKQKLAQWFEGGDVSGHEDEIIQFIGDKKNPFTDTDCDGKSVVFWAAGGGYYEILKAALRRSDAKKHLNLVHDGNTALSKSAYYGYDDCVKLLVDSGAKFLVKNGASSVDGYRSLGLGYLQWPIGVEDYKEAFEYLVRKDSGKPNRKTFSDKYANTSGRAYLACLRLYDQLCSKMKDGKNQFYKQRDLLSVENDAVRRFFRFGEGMRVGGVAQVLEPLLFSAQPVDLSGYSTRSVVIVLVRKMRATTEATVQATINTPGDHSTPGKKIFSIKFKLAETVIDYEWFPDKWQRGQCIIKVNGRKPDLYGVGMENDLERLTGSYGGNDKVNARTKKLGSLLLQKTKKLEPFYHHEFTYVQASGGLKVRICHDGKSGKAAAAPAQVAATIHKLNGLLILWSIAEPARRLSGHKAKPSDAPIWKQRSAINLDSIPVAIMQIRALRLLAEGVVGVRDLFGHSEKYMNPPYNNSGHKAQYGVPVGRDLVVNFEVAKEKAKDVGQLDLPLPALVTSPSFLSRNYTKELLREGYGSADESDDGDYSDHDYAPAFI
jgi:hypothetical protein